MSSFIASYYDEIGNKYRTGGFDRLEEAKYHILDKAGLDGKVYLAEAADVPVWEAPQVEGGVGDD